MQRLGRERLPLSNDQLGYFVTGKNSNAIATLDYVIHFAWANEMQQLESELSSPFGEIFLSVRHALIVDLKPFLSRSTFVTISKPMQYACLHLQACKQNSDFI